MVKKNILGTIATIVFIIFAAILIIQIIISLSGKSPTEIQIVYISLGVIVSYLFVMSYTLGVFVGEVKEFMKVTKNTFKKIGENLNRLEEKIDLK